MKDVWGVELSIDLKGCDPQMIRDEKTIQMFVVELCMMIDVKPYGETIIVDFGQDEKVSGFSMVQLIETSLISAHFVNKTNAIYMNIFSCNAFDPLVAVEYTKKFFKAKHCEFVTNYRMI